MFKQSIPPEDGEIAIEEYLDTVVPRDLISRDNGSTYRDQRAVMTVEIKARDGTSSFEELMRRYLKSDWAKQYSGNFDLASTHSWEEVIELTQRAQKSYDNAIKKKSGFVRRLFRVAGDWSSTIQPWIALLPSSTYGSVICGAFKIVLSACADRTEICEKIADTFNQVQDIQIKISRHLDLYSGNRDIKICATETYISFLAMIQSMVKTLVDMPTHMKIFQPFLGNKKRPAEYADLGMNEETFKYQAKRLDELAEHLHKKTVVEMNESMISSRSDLSGVDKIAKHNRKALSDVASQNDEIYRQNNEMSRQFKEFRAGQSEVITRDQLKEALIQYVDMINWHLAEGPKGHRSTPKDNWVRDRLLATLGANFMHSNEENESAEKMVPILERHFQSTVRPLLRSERFRTFLSSRDSGFLPITSPWEDDAAVESFTPMSVIAKTLADCVMPLNDKHVIRFYCGFHTSRDDRFFGPVGLMKSLVVQLLQSDLLDDFDFNSINKPAYRELLEFGQFEVCELFTTLVHSISERSALFCIIDGLSLFQVIEPELTYMSISVLETTVKTMVWHAAFKVLTTTCGSRHESNIAPLYLSEDLYEFDDGETLQGTSDTGLDLLSGQGQLRTYQEATGSSTLPEGCE